MSTRTLRVIAWSPAGGGLIGLSPVWTHYVNAVTQTDLTSSAPGISEIGGGFYVTTVDNDCCGMIFMGADGSGLAALNAYNFIEARNATTFPLFQIDSGSGNSVPLAGEAASHLSWAYVFDTFTAATPSPVPGFVELGGGCYGLSDWLPSYLGLPLCNDPHSAVPQPEAILPNLDGPGTPSISLITPAPGSVITATTAIALTLQDTDEESFSAVVLMASFSGSVVWEVIYDSTRFAPLYLPASSYAATAPNEVTLTVSRVGGWPSSPTFRLVTVDATGQVL